MLNNKKIAVVVPAYNEEKQIGTVLQTIPSFVDRIVVVDDCSKDGTVSIVMKHVKEDGAARQEIKASSPIIINTPLNRADTIIHKNREKEIAFFVPFEILNQDPDNERIILMRHKKNGGVGASIACGYNWCLDHHIDCTAVMAGDGQMDPSELESLVRPVIDEGVDYVKGNRLIHRSAWFLMPKIRFLGNSILSILTKIASGYWRVSDTQCGYTAISLKALQAIRIYKIYRRFGMPNDLLVTLNISYCTIREVGVKPVYGVGENSKMRILKVVPMISWLLCKCFFKRLWGKYFFRDFHPIFLFYHLAFIMGIILCPYTVKIAGLVLKNQNVSFETLMAFMFLAISSFQALFFAMWMDIQDNERLYK
jgi:glycosyltransferase involved in cell wall biosynthesis